MECSLYGSIKKIKLRPIGVVHTYSSDNQIRKEAINIEGIIEILPEFEEGLEGQDEG